MAKGKRQHKEPTKKQIAVSRREKKQQKRVLIALGVVAILVLGVALAGLFDQLVAKPSRPVAVVNDVRIRTDEYQSRVLYERFMLDTVMRNLQTQLSLLDPEDPANEFVANYYQQIASQTNQQRLGVDRQTLDDMVDEQLVSQKAAELGLNVSEDELDDAIRARIASLSGFLTEAQATAVASTAVAVTATAETFTPTPEPTPTSTLTATLVTTDTPDLASEIPTPAPTPTRHIMTEDEFNQNYADYLSLLKEQADLTEAEYRHIIEAQLLFDKVYQHFADQEPTEADQVNISHIQLDTQEEAEAVLERLNAGEDFALVASEVSTDTFTAADGGELGWFLEGELVSRFGGEFESAAFSLSPGKYSDPVPSPAGWHILKVNEHSLHPLSSYQLRTQQQQAFSNWLQEAQSGEGVEILWDPGMAPPDPLLERSANPAGGSIPVNSSNQ
ncbi:MAG: peptidylprolyl isomerase [Anaerolineales bacterium]|nr:MAG: peptidylprolyl isomerase [Anaerolineales bacterium]